jgi:hypothetical protein
MSSGSRARKLSKFQLDDDVLNGPSDSPTISRAPAVPNLVLCRNLKNL